MSKDYFIFSFFEKLEVGDTFKFSKSIEDNIQNKFYTVYKKNRTTTKFNATYGKTLNRMELPNETQKEVMIYPNRKNQKK